MIIFVKEVIYGKWQDLLVKAENLVHLVYASCLGTCTIRKTWLSKRDTPSRNCPTYFLILQNSLGKSSLVNVSFQYRFNKTVKVKSIWTEI